MNSFAVGTNWAGRAGLKSGQNGFELGWADPDTISLLSLNLIDLRVSYLNGPVVYRILWIWSLEQTFKRVWSI